MRLWPQYRNSLRPIETEEIIDLAFYRPLGFAMARLFSFLPVTPNMVTAAAMIMGIAAGCFYGLGRANTTFLAGLIFLGSNVFDCADGQLARLKGGGTKSGRIMDGLADYATGFATIAGMAVGYSGAFFTPLLWWMLVVVAGISIVIQSILVDSYRNIYIRMVTGTPSTAGDEYRELQDTYRHSRRCPCHGWGRAMAWFYLQYLRLAMKIVPTSREPRNNIDQHAFIRSNRRLVRGWTMIGSSTRITVAVIASLFNRPDIFLLIVIVPMNILASGLWMRQRLVSISTEG